MESAIIVSSSEKGAGKLIEVLHRSAYSEIKAVTSCGEARRLLCVRNFDLCIVNAPLPDEPGEAFAAFAAGIGRMQVILIVKAEIYDDVEAAVEDAGVFTIAKPLSRDMLWSALKLAGAAFNKLSHLERENKRLLRRIEDIRAIDRAKCLLIERLSMSEPDAHRFIEKQAMDRQLSKRAVAEKIIEGYIENFNS